MNDSLDPNFRRVYCATENESNLSFPCVHVHRYHTCTHGYIHLHTHSYTHTHTHSQEKAPIRTINLKEVVDIMADDSQGKQNCLK